MEISTQENLEARMEAASERTEERNPLHSYSKIYHLGHKNIATLLDGDVIEFMVGIYRNEARWEKAVQHLRDAGKLQGAPQDIGPLIKEFQTDLMEECAAEIKEKLYEYALPKILRGASAGLPEFYKAKLAKQQFEGAI